MPGGAIYMENHCDGCQVFLTGCGPRIKKNTNTLLSGIQCSEILSFNPISTFISFQNQYFRLQVILTLYLTVDGLSCFCVNLCFFQSGDASLRNYSICAWNHSRICVTLTLLGISSRFRSQFFPPISEQQKSKNWANRSNFIRIQHNKIHPVHTYIHTCMNV